MCHSKPTRSYCMTPSAARSSGAALGSFARLQPLASNHTVPLRHSLKIEQHQISRNPPTATTKPSKETALGMPFLKASKDSEPTP
ncbi:hypothetical protein ST47_g2819 [Ascochyta rabiei]|uniref:Uncharacterized protein n=1 Tax=Didymella rabiei TaxID=5454 RepID=A0A163J0K0_DIDRA|nr:hypothetical protein ST47_g2819 [Ascochyta rabiei]